MKVVKIYLDTSIISFTQAYDAMEKRELTLEFLNLYVKKGIYAVFISPIVIDEINKSKDKAQKDKLLEVIKSYAINVLDIC
ncbi:MAG: hypothetical protein HY769_10065 [Candidatus Stahlbacteria bacterium]|nr:hypothetical protein [Candidatus Stahlbacteria bacterium]